LYDFKRGYSNDDLPPDEVIKRRNGSETIEIVGSIWMELTRQLDDPLPKGDLITKALHYLKNAWTPVKAYRKDDRYCIDNSIAEHSIRTLTIERKNKMAFGSHKGAKNSTVYHTFIDTCKMGAQSFYQFLKNYLTSFMEGRTDFEYLTLDILGVINKKTKYNGLYLPSACQSTVQINGFQTTTVEIRRLRSFQLS